MGKLWSEERWNRREEKRIFEREMLMGYAVVLAALDLFDERKIEGWSYYPIHCDEGGGVEFRCKKDDVFKVRFTIEYNQHKGFQFFDGRGNFNPFRNPKTPNDLKKLVDELLTNP